MFLQRSSRPLAAIPSVSRLAALSSRSSSSLVCGGALVAARPTAPSSARLALFQARSISGKSLPAGLQPKLAHDWRDKGDIAFDEVRRLSKNPGVRPPSPPFLSILPVLTAEWCYRT